MDTPISYKFKVYDKIFAKVKGHPFWPAYIESIDLPSKIKKYNVVFYGDNTKACVKEVDICPYFENKSKYGKGKQKNTCFNKALKEAERSISRPSKLTVGKTDNIKNTLFESSNDSNTFMDIDQSNLAGTSTPTSSAPQSTPDVDSPANSKTAPICDKLQTPGIDITTLNGKVKELLGPNWISDDTLYSYFEIINFKTGLVKETNAFCVNPLISQGIKLLDDYKYLLDPPNLRAFDHLFIPVNDSVLTDGEGGSHWSLLVFNKLQQQFYHYDSCNGYNLKHARMIADRLINYLNDTTDNRAEIIECQTPQQHNGYDCAIYMVLMMDRLTEQLMNGDNCPQYRELLQQLSNNDLILKRSTMAYLLINGNLMLSKTIKDLLWNFGLCKSKSSLKHCDATGTTPSSTSHSKAALGFVQNKSTCKMNGQERKNINKKPESGVTVKSGSNRRAMPGHKTRQQVANLTTNKPEENPPSSECNLNPKHKISVISDSQGRALVHQLNTCLSEYSNFGYVQPGAPLEAIVRASANDESLSNFTKKDYLVWIGGTNNVSNNSFDGEALSVPRLISFLKKEITKYRRTNLIIATIPYRYDLSETSFENVLIKQVNEEIRKLAHIVSHVFLLDLHLLTRRQHTRHGLHVNKSGKRYISLEIKNLINQVDSKEIESAEPVINVIQANMEDIIDEKVHTEHTQNMSFEHCISSADMSDFPPLQHPASATSMTAENEVRGNSSLAEMTKASFPQPTLSLLSQPRVSSDSEIIYGHPSESVYGTDGEGCIVRSLNCSLQRTRIT